MAFVATGAGAIAGVPINIAGAATVAYGVTVVAKGAVNFAKDINGLVSSSGGNGTPDIQGGSNAGDFKFPKSNNDMKKVFGVNDKVFHKEIKPEILKQINKDSVYSKEFKKMGNNPDIGVDDAGNVVLKDVKTGKTLQTNWSFESFIP